MAAGRCVPPERTVHSLHAYFLRSGNPAETMRFAVDVMRESSAFTTVRVVAEQAERVLLSLEASFQVEEHGPETSIPAPAVPGPEETIPIDDWQLAYPSARSGAQRSLLRGCARIPSVSRIPPRRNTGPPALTDPRCLGANVGEAFLTGP